MKLKFLEIKDKMLSAFNSIKWISKSGMNDNELHDAVQNIESQNLPKAITKAKAFELI